MKKFFASIFVFLLVVPGGLIAQDERPNGRPYLSRRGAQAPQPTQSAETSRPDVYDRTGMQVGEPASKIWEKPGDPHPDRYADNRPTVTFQLETEGYTGWFHGTDQHQFQDYLTELVANRFQVAKSYNSPDLRHNEGEVVYSNSEWTRKATNRKTVGNMQNADFQLFIRITVGEPKQERADLHVRHGSGALQTWSTRARVTLVLNPVNNRAVLEQGAGAASGSVTRLVDVQVRAAGTNAGLGKWEDGAYESSREAVLKALVKAWKDMKRV